MGGTRYWLKEEFKLKSSDYNNKNTENPESWIDIKQVADGLSNITIREMIEVWLLGKAYKDFELKELNNQFDFFSISYQKMIIMGILLPFWEILKNL